MVVEELLEFLVAEVDAKLLEPVVLVANKKGDMSFRRRDILSTDKNDFFLIDNES